MRVAPRRFRAILATVLTLAVAGGTVTAPESVAAPAARVQAAASDPAPSDLTSATDRQKVARLWEFGGPATKRDAAAALAGTDADITTFLTTQKDPDASIDRDVAVNKMMSAGGPSTKTAAQQALDAGNDDALQTFLDTDWQTAASNDLNVRVNQMMSAGGPQVRKAGQAALDANTTEALQTFVDSGWQAPYEIDQDVKVNQAMSAGGPEVQRAAQQALDANTVEALDAFLAVDLPVAQARDAETDSITQLVTTAQAASAQAASETVAAKQQADRAVAEAAAAQRAAQAAKDAAAAAQGNASAATDAASRAAYAANQAAATAREAIGASNAATRAANTAAGAASRAAAAASRAGVAATNAYNAAAAAVSDKSKAAAASLSAVAARAAADSASTAANAARSARTASEQAGLAGDAAKDAAAQSQTAADNATQAANAAAAAGADSRQAQAAAAAARAQAARAVAAAQASQAWAREASTDAGQAADAADAAATNAQAAAAAADDAAAHAGQAADAAQQATNHANAATAAANAAVAAANQATQIAQAARTADDNRIALAGQEADDAAQAALGTVTPQPTTQSTVDQASTWDAETNRLIAEATNPGTDHALAVTDARKVALTLAGSTGQWTKESALAALGGTEDEAITYVTTGLWDAAGQDDRATLNLLKDSATPNFQTAADAALAGTDTAVRDFLRNPDYPSREIDDSVQVNQIMSAARTAGRTVVVDAAQHALDAGNDQALRTFLQTGQYTALTIDDNVKVNQVLSAARTAGSREVAAMAQAALDGPPTLAHEFLTTGQYTAARRDQNTAAHNAAIDGLLAQASAAASSAVQNANEAQAAAATARNAADEAANWANQAQAAAAQAADWANQAQAAAQRAADSAQQAQQSANTATQAAATAVAAADRATRSATWAQHSANQAANYAQQAATSATNAYNAARAAGKDATDAALAARDAWQAVATKAENEKQEFIQQRQVQCEDMNRLVVSTAVLSSANCVLLFTGTPADKERILGHLQEICRQHNYEGSHGLALCLDPNNLLSPNFRPVVDTSPPKWLDTVVLSALGGAVALLCPECALGDVILGGAADLGEILGLDSLATLANAAATGADLADIIGTRIIAEEAQAAHLAEQAAAEEALLAAIAEQLIDYLQACVPNSLARVPTADMAAAANSGCYNYPPSGNVQLDLKAVTNIHDSHFPGGSKVDSSKGLFFSTVTNGDLAKILDTGLQDSNLWALNASNYYEKTFPYSGVGTKSAQAGGGPSTAITLVVDKFPGPYGLVDIVTMYPS
ncbi:ALF repeat-containing protein [Amycolatopsis sp. GM8]|uniref:ALF repeat-containing protein n=1 Tax=Amycolatopsis sp. GM8 TaxID=2896530 RepID=UPI001F255D44|nr:ALF repeat-containing protein [Amycolatopsis sp. GM8]